MRNSEYWKQRFINLQEAQEKKANEYVEILKREYDKALINIEKNITVWYTRIAENNNLDLAEAKRLLSKKELKEFHWDIEEYIEKGRANAINQKWMQELENASSKVHIDRLEALRIQIQNELEQLANKQNEDTKNLAKQQYQEAYYKSAFEIQSGMAQYWKLQPLQTEKINKIISKPWTLDNKTFSDRIWTNKNNLLNTLQKDLVQATIRGEDLQKVINKISSDFSVAKGKAGRLVMTESAFFSSVGQKDCFSSLGVEQYEIVVTLDSHTSKICRDLDGKIFKMKDYEVGITAPPFHTSCRSTTAPHFYDEFMQNEKRAYRDEEGKTKYVNSKIKYHEWEEKYVTNIPEFEGNKTQMKEYTKEELQSMAIKANNIVKSYTDNESKWRGDIQVTENKVRKEWDCSISVDKYTTLDMLIHEQLHAHSISYFDRKIYTTNWKIEEATVQLLTQEICKEKGIKNIDSLYDIEVLRLRWINKTAKLYKNDMEFAKDLLMVPVTERLDFLEKMVYNNMGQIKSVIKLKRISKIIERLRS